MGSYHPSTQNGQKMPKRCLSCYVFKIAQYGNPCGVPQIPGLCGEDGDDRGPFADGEEGRAFVFRAEIRNCGIRWAGLFIPARTNSRHGPSTPYSNTHCSAPPGGIPDAGSCPVVHGRNSCRVSRCCPSNISQATFLAMLDLQSSYGSIPLIRSARLSSAGPPMIEPLCRPRCRQVWFSMFPHGVLGGQPWAI